MPKVAEKEKARRQAIRSEWEKTDPELRKAKKRERTKARRRAARGAKVATLAYKPVDEWDEEELARGRPRDLSGTFRGRRPEWLPTVIVEEAVSIFREVQEGRLRATVPEAITALNFCLSCDDVDGKGRRIVPVPTKLAAAQFAIEHLVGKPKQRVEADISVKLQAILAEVMVMPDGSPAIERQVLDLDSEEVES